MSNPVALIQAANRQLDQFLAQYGSGLLIDRSVPDLTPVMQTLDGVGQVFQQLPPPADLDSVSRAAIDEYVGKLKQLEITLEKLKPQLESRRDEIGARLAKVRAAMSWAGSLNQTR